MALGIEPNSIAPALIRDSGQALVQGIRQIGQQISGHLTEMQTKRDLAGLAQSLQGANVQSNEFPLQLAQIASQHPMAVRDERGQMLMGILGKAHGAWQASEDDARSFNRAMALQGYRQRAATEAAKTAEENRRSRPVKIEGVGLQDPLTGEVILPEGPKQGLMPYSSTPQGILDRRTGEITAPPTPKTITPAQAATDARLQKKLKIDLLMKQDTAAREEFGRLERRRDAISKQRMEIKDAAKDPNAAYLDNTVKAIEEEAKTLRQRRLDIQKAIEAIEIQPSGDVVEPTLGAVPPNAVAPAADVLPPLGAISGPVPVKNRAEAERLTRGTQYQTPDGRIFTRN